MATAYRKVPSTDADNSPFLEHYEDSAESTDTNETPSPLARRRWAHIVWRLIQTIAWTTCALALISFAHWIYITFISHDSSVAVAHDGDGHSMLGHHKVGDMKSLGHGDRTCDCGSSVAEARRMGCRYDSIMTAWLPDHCRDDELIDRFNHAGPDGGEWEYWSDLDKTRRLSMDEVGALADVDGSFYVSNLWHTRHCSYTWLKLWRSRWTLVQMSLREDTENHILHCMKMVESREALDRVTTASDVSLQADHPKKHHR